MIVEMKHFLCLLLVIHVNTQVSCDLSESQHICNWRELNVHDVLIHVDVRGLMSEGLGLMKSRVLFCKECS